MSNWIINGLKHSPEILLFLSLGFGYLIGEIRVGKFQLGGVAGSLLVGVALSMIGVDIDSGVKAVLFALFIYAVGFESGPQFFKSLGPKSAREICLALFVAIISFFTVILLSRFFSLDKGLAAGLAAGGLTQSAIIGTAGDALSHLGLTQKELQTMQANVAIGYAVTYVFGSLGAILICVNLLPVFMGRSIHDDAIKAQSELLHGSVTLGPNQDFAVQSFISRIYQYTKQTAMLVEKFEKTNKGVTIERLKRGSHLLDVCPTVKIKKHDRLLIVGRRDAVIAAGRSLGKERGCEKGMDIVMDTRDIVLRNNTYINKPIAKIKTENLRHGIYVIAIHRDNSKLTLTPNLVLKLGDVVTLYGADSDVKHVAKEIGIAIPISLKTDWVYHGLGVASGLILGLLVVKIGSIPLTLGAGGGALLSGLIFGWIRTRHQLIGNMPGAACQILKDLGLAGFVAVVGLQSGFQAITTIQESGLTLFLIGMVVTVVPLILAMLFGRFVLRYNNVAVFAGALSGSRSANPAFGGVLDKAGNSIPTTPFAITYALANVFLTLLGPLIVAFG